MFGQGKMYIRQSDKVCPLTYLKVNLRVNEKM